MATTASEAGRRLEVPSTTDQDELFRLRTIVAFGRLIGVEHGLDRLLERVVETCFELLHTERGAAVLCDPQSKAPFLTVTRARDGQPFAVSSELVGLVFATRRPQLQTQTIDGRARSMIAVPLAYEGDTDWLGAILLEVDDGRQFHARDLELLEGLACPTSLAIKNAMLLRRVQSVIGDEWRRLERVVRDLPLGIVVLDDRRRCVLVNQWVTRRGELGRIRTGDVIDSIAGVPAIQLIGAGTCTTVTTESDRILSLTADAMTDGRETVIVIVDLTEERERQNQAAHRDRVALVGQLAGGVAHDFNNLLHVILTYSNMLEDSLDDPDQRDDAHQITHAATSAAELTRQLLTFSRRELVKPKVIEVAHVVHRMEPLLHQTVGPRIELELSLGPRIPRVLMDASQLEQILMNLVINARDAIVGAGTVRVVLSTVELEDGERGLAAGRYASIEITDTGSGMTPEVTARIFEPYFTTKARNKGTGLGLATVHGVVQQAGGDIRVESAPGQGTRFSILLPATEQASDPRPVLGAPTHTATILVVDDDDNVRRATERILRSAGYAVLSASSGHNALAFARDHDGTIDLLLTDIVMPGLSGHDLAREIAKLDAAPRVLFMSGYHQHAPIGQSQFIPKPFQRTDLLEKVRTVLATEVTEAAEATG